MITKGEFGYETVNTAAQRRDPGSLLHWMERALLTLRECPEFGIGTCTPVDTGESSVLALRYDAPGRIMLAVTNLANRRRSVDLGDQPGAGRPGRGVRRPPL